MQGSRSRFNEEQMAADFILEPFRMLHAVPVWGDELARDVYRAVHASDELSHRDTHPVDACIS